jgi:hypothetical protein
VRTSHLFWGSDGQRAAAYSSAAPAVIGRLLNPASVLGGQSAERAAQEVDGALSVPHSGQQGVGLACELLLSKRQVHSQGIEITQQQGFKLLNK